ncbi:MAG: glycosyltransferase family 4 protein [Parcubacteria group bacterium]|nr:glycosyltransferase family 4 protein [Parcubacteria group bacterium]
MKIGIDCRTILDPKHGELAGVGHYTKFLVENLLKIDSQNKYVLFFDPRVGDAESYKRKNVTIKYFPHLERKKYLPFVHSHLLIARFLQKQKLNLFHSPASTVPLAYPGKSVVTIHDLAIYHKPEWFPKGQKFSTRIAVPQTVRRASKIIAVSEYTKKDIIKYFGIPDDKITVVHNGVEEAPTTKNKEDVKKKFNITQNFILSVSTLQPRKNIEGLIEAFDSLRSSSAFKDYQLVIAGNKGWNYESIFQLVKELALTKKVIFTGYISKNDKFSLLKEASLLVFPSFYEGFGLSILEAMQQGTPVVTSKITSMPEVAGEAGLLVDPYKEASMARGIKKVLTDEQLQQRMIKSGLIQAKKFSWRVCAERTLRVYQGI